MKEIVAWYDSDPTNRVVDDQLNKTIDRILATTRMPNTTDPMHIGYLRDNLKRGRAIGQMRLRLVLGALRGAWFELLLLAPTELMQLAMKEKWKLEQVFPLDDLEQGYSVVMEKMR